MVMLSVSEADSEAIPAELRITLLGPPLVQYGQAPLALARRQTRALLYRLACETRAIPREQLCYLFWPDTPETTARRSLAHLLTHLRRALPDPDVIVTAHDQIGLDFTQVWSDSVVFKHLSSTSAPHGRSEALHRAIQLVQGPFLDGFSLPDAPEFEAWADQERHIWERRILDMLAALIDDDTARGAYADAIRAAQHYLTIDALAEEVHRQLIALYAATGDRSAALRQFEHCRMLLERELGVSPLPETQAMYDAVLAGQPVLRPRPEPASEPRLHTTSAVVTTPPDLRPPVSATLPALASSLIGREQELAAVCETLQRSDVRLLTLSGPGGAGKTRLGIEAAAQMRDRFAQGAVFVALAPLRAEELVVAAIAQALGVSETGDRSLMAGVQTALRDKQLLLVLDNFEHVAAAAPLVAELLAAAPDLKILITSRSPLRISGEHTFALPPLALPELANLPPADQLAQIESVALFLARVRTFDPTFQLTAANARQVAAICVRLDGLPLALELAAARMNILSPKMLFARLEHRLALLTDGPRDLAPRQRTLRATIDWSYTLLDLSAQLLLGRLAVFAGGWTLDAAEAVSSAIGPLAASMLDSLQALIDHQLIQRNAGADNEPRFTMLETIREYALEHLTERGEAATAQRAHAAYFCDWAERAERALHGPDQIAWLDQLDQEHANLRAALAWALEAGEADIAVRLSGALWWFWFVRGYASEGRRWLERVFDLVERIPAPAVALARPLYGAGLLALFQGDYAAARARLTANAEIWRPLANPTSAGQQARRELANTLVFLALSAHYQSDPAFQSLLAELEPLLGTLDDPAMQALILFNSGRGALLQRGDYRAARQPLEQCLRLFRAMGDAWYVAQAAIDLGLVALYEGNFAEAQTSYDEGLALARALKDRALVALALNNLGELARTRGDYQQAAAIYAESLQLHQDLGGRSEVPRLLHNLGFVALHQGDVAQARSQFRQCLDQFEEIHVPRGIAEGLAGLAAVAVLGEEPERAARLWGAADALREMTGTPTWPPDQREHDRYQAIVRSQLDEPTFAAMWLAGRALSLEQALAEARTV